MTIDRTFRSR